MFAKVTIHDKVAATTVANPDQLKAILKTASEEARSKNILGAIVIEAANRNSITMVVGGDETVLSFTYGHLNPPYYASKGTADKDQPVLTCYLTFQHHSEFSRKNVIPYDDGARAVEQFLNSGELPTKIKWEEV